MKGYDWNNHPKVLHKRYSDYRRWLSGATSGSEEKDKKIEKEIEIINKEQEMKFHKKVVKVYNTLESDDLQTLVDVISKTETLKPHDKIKQRKQDLYPIYKKYVDPRAKLNSGCGSCVKAQSSFFEQLIKYHNVQETK